MDVYWLGVASARLDSTITMANPQPEVYTIFCALIHECRLFSVKVPIHDTVDDLKDAIKHKKSALHGIDADALDVYQVDIPEVNSFNHENLRNAVKQRLESGLALEVLSPMLKLSAIYSTTPKDHALHLIVQLPSTEIPERSK
jgi:hypothetical protein